MRINAVPGKRISVAYMAAGVSIILMTFVTFAVAAYSGALNTEESSNIWVSSDAKLIPFYPSEDAMTPIGYILEQKDRRTICRIGEDRVTYTCTYTDLRR